ncbi:MULTISPECIES: MerR family transcriptional regulator [unclassified Brevundimonas]|uniref:MerR family transcriptional regulator n=1 Tax=unclassified Brevundimonas TaxID=2622653 RepID=UPI000C6781CC|nr:MULTISPECIES: MerR family transcriptional regulator [unclassified Brevundimonas]MAL89840.1 MerR family transcriptional regulator [Brevundimonas sp.]HAJ01677.1 MerR family transcriptional regulator [Brevundimonas sp.]HAV48862.1 MerR family transcriptional regulator [Brevundimonas sp.]
MAKSPEAFRSISEAATEVGVPQHVLRFWETKFAFVSPVKRAGGRRFYRPEDIDILKGVRRLLHEEGLTLKGVARLHKAQGIKRILGQEEAGPAPESPVPDMPTRAPTPPAATGLSSDQRQRLAEVLRDIEAAQSRLEAALSR